MTRLTSHITESDDPFANLALEEALCTAVENDEVILYLWQNRNTIVIGRNQNPWKECRVEAFENDDGRIARRRSGGGAVFHDLGNLNFTFVARDPLYHVERNCNIICEAVRSFGLDARMTGRNDIAVDGAKFSGNAFLNSGTTHCHHGTLMVGVDTALLGAYLNPDPRKLAAKGVESVRSRVVNLSSLEPRITTEALGAALIAAAEREFGASAESLDSRRLDATRVTERTQFFGSQEWCFGATLPFTHRFDERFTWGDFDVNLVVKDGVISEAQVFSDALDTEFIAHIERILPGCAYNSTVLAAQMEASACTPEQRAMARDCAACIERGMT